MTRVSSVSDDTENQLPLFPPAVADLPGEVQLPLAQELRNTRRRLALAPPAIDQVKLGQPASANAGADSLIPDAEGLLSRVVKPHSAEKAERTFRYADAVG